LQLGIEAGRENRVAIVDDELGPEWVYIRQNGLTGNSVAGEAVLDFMFWPSVKRRFGWYLEPGYEYSFGRGHEKSVGISFGLLIAIQRR
jgi:hypothetical protein